MSSGLDFERICADVLRSRGFTNVKVTRASGDQGVDILANKNGLRYAIQCKYYSKPVGNKAVQEAHAGKAYYRCDRAMVMTNNTFTKSARDLARATGTELLDNVSPCGSLGISWLWIIALLIVIQVALLVWSVPESIPYIVSTVAVWIALYALTLLAEAKGVTKLSFIWKPSRASEYSFAIITLLFLFGLNAVNRCTLADYLQWALCSAVFVGLVQLATSILPYALSAAIGAVKRWFVARKARAAASSATVQHTQESPNPAPSTNVEADDTDSDNEAIPLPLITWLADADPLLNDAIEVVVETQMASVSMLQRRLKLGYAHAAHLVDQLEEMGIVGPFQGSKPRKILVTKKQWAKLKVQHSADGPTAEAEVADDTVKTP